ncbi:hypothetical protein F2Q69_00018473 [Brassica cretica]|uniref:Uncharacterized protein n=1 Tax=Brassica cretica TaxID=69181 RepID=A0A8S9QAU5_BRACR|nr:hypothetical protein F2Q69_00018473 [Brassica cretica]
MRPKKHLMRGRDSLASVNPCFLDLKGGGDLGLEKTRKNSSSTLSLKIRQQEGRL